MKKLIYLLMFLPVFVFGQKNTLKTAEDFVVAYFKLFEDKKWDEVPGAWAKDAQIVRLDGGISPALEMINNIIKLNESKVESDKIDIKWISTDAFNATSAMVSVRFTESIKRVSVPLRVTDNIGVFLVVKEKGNWKFKKWITGQNFAIIFENSIDKKYKTDPLASISRYTSACNQFWGMILYNLESSMQSGITAAEAGKTMGLKFAATWDASKGFEELANGFTWGLQVMSNYVEILERNEDTLKARILPPSNVQQKAVARENLRIAILNLWSQIAIRMGGECTLTDDGTYWILEFDRIN